MFSINEMKELMAMGFTTDQIVAMSNDSSSKASKPNRSTSKVEREEKRKEEREEFKKTHKLVYTKEENRQRVYEAMGYKKGDTFDRKLYEATAKKLGVLGKRKNKYGNYSIVCTWEEIK